MADIWTIPFVYHINSEGRRYHNIFEPLKNTVMIAIMQISQHFRASEKYSYDSYH